MDSIAEAPQESTDWTGTHYIYVEYCIQYYNTRIQYTYYNTIYSIVDYGIAHETSFF